MPPPCRLFFRRPRRYTPQTGLRNRSGARYVHAGRRWNDRGAGRASDVRLRLRRSHPADAARGRPARDHLHPKVRGPSGRTSCFGAERPIRPRQSDGRSGRGRWVPGRSGRSRKGTSPAPSAQPSRLAGRSMTASGPVASLPPGFPSAFHRGSRGSVFFCRLCSCVPLLRSTYQPKNCRDNPDHIGIFRLGGRRSPEMRAARPDR